MDNWIIINKIKNGAVEYSINDEVVIFRRKGKYPVKIKDNTTYIITDIEGDFLILKRKDDANWKSYTDTVKVHKTYMIQPGEIRNIKLDILLR